ncbi:hypothetical protein GQ44DRAFT_731932 [Phaeosphaeriaceae sp. PMI808]|nr:hypothetical protein GQ44DRAFT_731932 [Phaeosphaeriaceae sp. PMI808]
MTYPRGASKEKLDIPEEVWKNARPSLWNGRHGSQTSFSTPLGSGVDLKFSMSNVAITSRHSRPAALDLSHRESIPKKWLKIQCDASIQQTYLQNPDDISPRTLPNMSTQQNSTLHKEWNEAIFSHGPNIAIDLISGSLDTFKPGPRTSFIQRLGIHELDSTAIAELPANPVTTEVVDCGSLTELPAENLLPEVLPTEMYVDTVCGVKPHHTPSRSISKFNHKIELPSLLWIFTET